MNRTKQYVQNSALDVIIRLYETYLLSILRGRFKGAGVTGNSVARKFCRLLESRGEIS